MSQIFERLSSEASTIKLFAALQMCALSIRDDPPVRTLFEDGFSFLHRCLDEPGFVRAEQFSTTIEQLRTRWTDLLEENLGWKEGFSKVEKAWEGVRADVEKDYDFRLIRAAAGQLSEDVKSGIGASVEGEGTFARFSWIWRVRSFFCYHSSG